MSALNVPLASETDLVSHAVDWLRKLVSFALLAPSAIFTDTQDVLRNAPTRQTLMAGRRAAIGSGVPLVLASVFLGLFALGNPLIGEWLVRTDLGGFPSRLYEALASALRVAIVALLCWPFLRVPVLPQSAREPQTAFVPSVPLDFSTVIRSLVLFNIVFGAQNALDLAYLWGEGTLPDHLTYAQYAHRGTYPLALAAMLVGAFVVFAMPPCSNAERSKASRWLVFLWLAQTGLLTLSCLKRLDLYVTVYSLTYLRVTAILATGAIGVGLVWIFARLALMKSSRWLVNACVVTGLAGLFAGSIVDIGARIAWFNVTHNRHVGGEGVQLDLRYLRDTIGVSAIPALAWYEAHRGTTIVIARYHAGDAAENVRIALTRRFEADSADWRAWTLRRWMLAAEIEEGR